MNSSNIDLSRAQQPSEPEATTEKNAPNNLGDAIQELIQRLRDSNPIKLSEDDETSPFL